MSGLLHSLCEMFVCFSVFLVLVLLPDAILQVGVGFPLYRDNDYGELYPHTVSEDMPSPIYDEFVPSVRQSVRQSPSNILPIFDIVPKSEHRSRQKNEFSNIIFFR